VNYPGMHESDINYTKEAFLNPWNLAFLIVAMLTAFFLSGVAEFSNLVLVIAAAFELLYLGIVPRDERFRRVVRAQHAAERNKPPSQKEIFQLLSRYSQRRYAKMRRLEQDIQANYRKLSFASQGMLEAHQRKIDGLLDSYLNLLYQKERYEHTSHQDNETNIARAIETLRATMARDSDRVKAIKRRRLSILEQRLERLKRGRENLDVINAQIETIEDVVLYIHEQSLTLRDPEGITSQLDALLRDVEDTEASVVEMEELFASPRDLLTEMDFLEEPRDEEEALRARRTRE
jgi:hypothetical protein